jgi:hypothetical protein
MFDEILATCLHRTQVKCAIFHTAYFFKPAGLSYFLKEEKCYSLFFPPKTEIRT